MKMGVLVTTVVIFSLVSGAFGQARYGNFLGQGPSLSEKEVARRKAEEAKRIAEEKRKADQEADARYNLARKGNAPAMTNRVMQFRLQQATNGNYLYQCKVATNYLNGTDGFPTNKVLAQYWLSQALMNTNR